MKMKLEKLSRYALLGLVGLCLTFAAKEAIAAAGSLDTTFGKSGVTVTTLTTASDTNGVLPFSVQLQSDGKILVLVEVLSGSSTNSEVLRYTTSGTLDSTFGSKGIAVLPVTLGQGSLAVQSNGQIVIAGTIGSEVVAERLNTNGTIDNSFGSGGASSASLSGGGPGDDLVILIETNGDILVGGQLFPAGRGDPTQTFLTRFTSGGALDTTFGSKGVTIATANQGCTALAELSTGGILVVNGENISQFTASGNPLSGVTGGSIVATAGSGFPSAASVFQQNSNFLFADTVFVGEPSRAHNASSQVLSFASNNDASSTFASPDFHFSGSGGFGIEAMPNAMAVQSNGNIVVVGLQSTTSRTGTTIVNGLARLTANGDLDSTFGVNGTITNSVPAGTQGLFEVAIQTDGKIIAIGLANDFTALTISRYLGQ